MKKLLLSALAVSAIIGNVSAQEISIGPRLGLNFAKIKATGQSNASGNSYNDQISNRTGFLGGVSFQRNLFENFFYQLEALYIQQGTSFDGKIAFTDPATGIAANTEVKSSTAKNYLQVPLLAKFMFGSEKVKFSVSAGPYGAYWLSGKTKQEIDGKEQTVEHKFDTDDSDGYKDKRLDIGLIGGVGVGYVVGPGMLTLDLRYNHGFAGNIASNTSFQGSQIPSLSNYSNRGFNVSVGYLFTLEE